MVHPVVLQLVMEKWHATRFVCRLGWVNDKNFVKNLLNKKIIKISPKLTISEIIDEAVGDAEVDDPTDYALTNENFSAKL